MTQLSDSEAIRNEPPTAGHAVASDPSSVSAGAGMLVMAAAMPQEQLTNMVAFFRDSFPSTNILVATPDNPGLDPDPSHTILPVPATNSPWPLSAADFVNASQIADERSLGAILMLGPEAGSLNSVTLHELASATLMGSTDLVMSCYDLPAHAGLVNSSILFPVIRALFASRIRFPLAIDMGLSQRMAARLAAVAKSRAGNPGEMLLWPVNEASVGGFTISDINVGRRVLPQPRETDFNAIFAQVIGSLFADVESKAAFWQRPRRSPPARAQSLSQPETDGTSDVVRMVEAFRLATTNLQEIWSLVLSPNSLVGLKRLSAVDATAFRMPEGLWARVVFDFLIAYKLRAINRGHLLGALIPIYLAWVAGHINITSSGVPAEHHIEAVAAAFEADKPYVVSRWRWPDRFNP